MLSLEDLNLLKLLAALFETGTEGKQEDNLIGGKKTHGSHATAVFYNADNHMVHLTWTCSCSLHRPLIEIHGSATCQMAAGTGP